MVQVDEATKGTVLSAFYWGYGISQVGTLLPERHWAQPEDAVHLCSRRGLQAGLATHAQASWSGLWWLTSPPLVYFPYMADCCIMGASLPRVSLADELHIWEADFTQQPRPRCAHAKLPSFCLQFPASVAHQQHPGEVFAQRLAATLQLLRWLQMSGTCVAPRCHSHPALTVCPALHQ